MELNEIKKRLYKENPTAELRFIGKGKVYYKAVINNIFNVYFKIPFAEMGDTTFELTMPAKHLIRWITDDL